MTFKEYDATQPPRLCIARLSEQKCRQPPFLMEKLNILSQTYYSASCQVELVELSRLLGKQVIGF